MSGPPRVRPAHGRALAVLGDALDAHRDALAACRRCGHAAEVLPILSEARTPRVMLVGQAPGKTEVADRRPFAGRSGKTLFRWLADAGLEEASARERVYIAAITRCYPGPSPTGRGDRVPSPREREMCRDWLEAELRLIRPRLVIPVGRLAIDRFLRSLPLDQVVGRAHRWPLPQAGPGARTLVVPLPHPSGASSWVQQPAHQALLRRALALLGAALRELGVVPAQPARGGAQCAARRPARNHAWSVA